MGIRECAGTCEDERVKGLVKVNTCDSRVTGASVLQAAQEVPRPAHLPLTPDHLPGSLGQHHNPRSTHHGNAA